ncbi:MAG TPA: hypothetical protein VF485_10520 [Sphingomonas sp.]
MGTYLPDRPAISTSVEIRAELLLVVSRADIAKGPDGEPRALTVREPLSPFRPINSKPSQIIPVSMDKRLAIIYAQIVEEQVRAITRSLDFIDEHGFLAFDMATGRVTA